jgi:SAM-dependent methyltransferase
MERPAPDASNGYEAVAAAYLAGRGTPSATGFFVGRLTVSDWMATLEPGGAVLDLGCGPGYPVTQLLADAGFAVAGIDASPTMVAAFRARFPHAPVECGAAERSDFFGRQFDGIIAWGLMFLLEPPAQAEIIRRVAPALVRGGRFVFTAPREVCEWTDIMTGQRSVSLGEEAYRGLLTSAGLVLVGDADDEGDNHYYMTVKP